MRNWIVALLAVMDAAALSLVLRPHDRQVSARILLRQGIECMRDLAVIENIDFDPTPRSGGPIALPKQEFVDAVEMLKGAGYDPQRSAEDAWPLFSDWRMMYEPIAYELAYKIDAVPAVWSGPRRPHTDPIAPQRPEYVVSSSDGGIAFSDDFSRPNALPRRRRLG